MTAKEKLLKYLNDISEFIKTEIADDVPIIGITHFGVDDSTYYISNNEFIDEEIINIWDNDICPDEGINLDLGLGNEDDSFYKVSMLYKEVFDEKFKNYKEAAIALRKKVPYINIDF